MISELKLTNIPKESHVFHSKSTNVLKRIRIKTEFLKTDNSPAGKFYAHTFNITIFLSIFTPEKQNSAFLIFFSSMIQHPTLLPTGRECACMYLIQKRKKPIKVTERKGKEKKFLSSSPIH